MIKSIKFENFLSWKDGLFPVENGVTLITGYNYDDDTSEGSGKSAVLNAMSWGLYGKLPKDVKIDEVVRHGQKGCRVELNLDNVKIVRSRKPNDVFMVVEDKEVRGKDARETQQMIEDFIGISFDTFCQTIYFAQNYPKKFIAANQEDKGKILSEIQNLEIFDKGRKEVHELAKLEISKIADFDNSIEILALKVLNIGKLIFEAENNKRRIIEDSESRIQNLITKKEGYLNNLAKNREELEININKLNEINLKQINLDRIKSETEINNLENDRNLVQTELSGIAQQKELVNTYKKDIDKYIDKKRSYEKSLSDAEDGLYNLKKKFNEIDLKELSIKESECENIIENAENDRSIIQSKISGIAQQKELLNTYTNELQRYRYKKEPVAKKRRELIEFIKNPTKNCPTCGTLLEKMDTSCAESELVQVEKELSDLGSQADDLEKKISDFEIEDESQLRGVINSIDEVINAQKNTINDIMSIRSTFEILKESITTKNSHVDNIRLDLKDTISKIDDLWSKINHIDIPDAEELQTVINNINNNIQNQKDIIKSIDLKEKEIAVLTESNKTKELYIQTLEQDVISIESDIAKEREIDLSEFDNKIDSLNSESREITEQRHNVEMLKLDTEEYIKQLETLKSGFKEIKSYVFNTILNELMIKANKYAEELFEVPVRIIFSNDNMKINTEVSLNGQEMSLGLLSGGQYKRACLAIDLALSDITTARKGDILKLIILDEPFQNLSEISMHKCIRLIEKLDKSVILIEHNSIAQSIVNNTFNVELRDGVSSCG